MQAGMLRDRVTFERSVEVSDGLGGSTITWQVLFERWAAVRFDRDGEKLEAGRLREQVTGRVTVRYDTETRTLETSDRVLIDGAPCQIRSVIDPTMRRRYLDIRFERGAVT